MGYTYDAENFKEIFEKNFTWLNGFMRNVRRFPDKTAMIDPLAEQSWTYTELNETCNRLANALQNDGIGKNDVVLFQLLNSPQFAFCYIAPQNWGPSTPLLTLILPLAKQHVCLTIIVQKLIFMTVKLKKLPTKH